MEMKLWSRILQLSELKAGGYTVYPTFGAYVVPKKVSPLYLVHSRWLFRMKNKNHSYAFTLTHCTIGILIKNGKNHNVLLGAGAV